MLRKVFFLLFIFVPGIMCLAAENPTVTVNIMIRQQEQLASRNIEVMINEFSNSPETADESADIILDKIEETFAGYGIEEDDYFILGMHSGKNDDTFYSSRNIQVTLPKGIDMDLFIKSVTDAGASGISDYNRFGGFLNMVNDEDYPGNLEEAVLAAEEKAERIASAFRANLGRVLEIRELNFGSEGSSITALEVTYELIMRR